MLFEVLNSCRVEVDLAGGHLRRDGGALLLRLIDNGLEVIPSRGTCFSDALDARLIEHSVAALPAQRVHSIALNYEDY